MQEMIPFRWPAEWKDPSKLSLIKGTPINCIVGEAPPPFAIGDIKFIELGDDPPEGIALREGVWPRVLPAEEEDAAEAGATGGAWVDSNTWTIRLAQTMEPGKSVWLDYEAPGANEVTALADFARTVVEAQVYNSRWIITLSQAFREGLDSGSDEALRGWKRMASAMNLFESKPEWKSMEPMAALGVVSTFEGESELLSAEFLNMAPRRHLAHRIIREKDLAAASIDDLKAIIYIEGGPPQGEVREKLLQFAKAGGLLITPQGLVDSGPYDVVFKYHVHPYGKGRVAMPPEGWFDPFLLVAETHILLGRREDVVRVWNGADMNSHYMASTKGGKDVVHLIQYSAGTTQPVTLGFSKPYRSAVVHTLESEKTVKAEKGELGVEIPVGEFSSYAAIELEV